ncbi:MAG: adenosine deaminase [Lachnospiraceae bacterium]|nr:adenosine deaminase [Lachnospiraceae bacterium]
MKKSAKFGTFYLDKEKDLIVDLTLEGDEMHYVLRTPNHGTGNLIRNLARLCNLPLSEGEDGLMVVRGTVPCYIDRDNRKMYIFRLLDTKVASIFPDGTIEIKASIPAISKTLMSQTKHYALDFKKTIVKTYILNECKFHTDLHTHMNANLDPDVLIALGIRHEVAYPLYYIRKLGLRLSDEQAEALEKARQETERIVMDEVQKLREGDEADKLSGGLLQGKHLRRRIEDRTVINFADLILNNPGNAAYNIPRIRASLAVMKDGQAVFTNLEKVYLYRYVFTKGTTIAGARGVFSEKKIDRIPDPDIVRVLKQMLKDRESPEYKDNSLFQNALLWVARQYQKSGISYAEISDTSLVKRAQAAQRLAEIHEIMPKATRETGVTLRFLAALRRVPLTIIRDRAQGNDYFRENLPVLGAIACDPYVAGCDIVGEEINDIRDLAPVIRGLVSIAERNPGFVFRVHAGENDSLPDNILNSIRCVRQSLSPGQPMPRIRIGHGLYTPGLHTKKGQLLLEELQSSGAVLEFQITSNVRLNNLSTPAVHPIRQYLAAGLPCVQGTDGGALYGTDSIDEELALTKMLDLTREDLLLMRKAEDRILKESLAVFRKKAPQFEAMLQENGQNARDFLRERVGRAEPVTEALPANAYKEESAEVFKDAVRLLPDELVPIVVAGGSYNNARHTTKLRRDICALLDELVEKADPDKVYFVIGYRLSGYEKYLLTRNKALPEGRRKQIFAYVPSEISPARIRPLLRSGVGIRVGIDPSGLGIYKSVTHEIFKRRPAILLVLDGHSAAVNLIQDAKNSDRPRKVRGRMFLSAHARTIRQKASSLQGYAELFSDTTGFADRIIGAADRILPGK